MYNFPKNFLLFSVVTSGKFHRLISDDDDSDDVQQSDKHCVTLIVTCPDHTIIILRSPHCHAVTGDTEQTILS